MRKVLWLLLALASVPAVAAVTPNSWINAQTPNIAALQFTSSSTAATYATLYTAGPNGSKCYGLQESNNDTVTHVITLQLVNGGSVTGSIAASTASVTGSITGTVLTVTATTSGILVPGELLSGTNVAPGTTILNQTGGTPQGVGTYNVSLPSSAASTTISGTYGTVTVSAVSATTPGGLAVGDILTGTNVVANTIITGLGTGLGGTGTYYVTPNTVVASTTITATAPGLFTGNVRYGGTSYTTVAGEGFAGAVNRQITGTLNAPGVWLGLPADQAGNFYITIPNGWTLQVTFATAITASDLLNFEATCADF